PLDQAASRIQKGLRVVLRDAAPLEQVAKRLATKGEDEIFLVLPTGAGEVELKLPGKYQASPQVAAALKAIPGIANVEHV
ncbi:MAG: hypothetical protein ACREC1_09490, partial [Methylovirgula sp.]